MYFQKPEKFLSPYVIELGSYTTRAGYSGCDLPTRLYRTEMLNIPTDNGDQFFNYNPIFLNDGVDLEQSRQIKPVMGNCVEDWDVMEEYLDWILIKESKIDLSETPLLIVEPPVHVRENRIKFVEMLFEKFETIGVSFVKSAQMSAYLSSRENALVVDIGAYNTYITPVHEGFIMNKAMSKYDFGGEVLTNELRKIINKKYVNIFNFPFVRNKSIYENEIVSDYIEREFCADVKACCCKVSDVKLEDGWKYNEIVEKTSYDLPDDRKITVCREAYEIPEIMVNSKKSGQFGIPTVQEMILMIKEKIDVEPRKDIMSNIILTGGTANMTNFMERQQKELMNELVDTHYTGKIKSQYFF